MKKWILSLLAHGICLASMSAEAPERILLPAFGVTQEIADPQDLAARIEALAASSNFHSGEKGGLDTTLMTVHVDYRKCVASGRYIVVRYGKPYSLRIVGNREVRQDLSVREIVIGITEDRMPSALFAITDGNEVLAFSKFRGDLAVQIQKTLAATADGNVGQDSVEPKAEASSDKDESRLSISPADYKVVSVAGVFGTYGISSVGDVVRFDPNKILNEKPRTLEFKPADDRPGPAYLNLPEFRLERVLHHKGHNVGFSFFCRQGIQPGGSLLRFDLRTDWDKMFVVYESDGIVHGVMILEKILRNAK
ncbi:MAG TPA: hypothetical protein VLO11_11880 [Luteolibacter sp.]|nr:hypothetical protein [Luteolibacter sp.]